jgi:glycosyltransferase involved in cell wall biosynthesis
MYEQAREAANDTFEFGPEEAPARVRHAVLIGNFPPRRCGIATFTQDVYAALTGPDSAMTCAVAAMNEDGAAHAYGAAVAYTLTQNRLEDYARTAAAIDASEAEIVCLQHEYGIFGGPAGEHILTLLYNVRQPVVTTLHTVLRNPTGAQKRVMQGLIARSSTLIVMAEKGRRILRETYDAPAHKIAIVPHGAPDRPLTDTAPWKRRLGFDGRELILTFGLLSPNKGIETMIRAMPAIKQARPDALYVILGATHPHLIAKEGEAYRERLIALAGELGVADSVRFVNEYVDHEKLLAYLQAADVYVSPYLNEAQITSGTISYAVALGTPVISTPYWHAQELLAGGVGMLVGFNDSEAFAHKTIALLSDEDLRARTREKAYAVGRDMIWPRLAARYRTVFNEAAARPAPRRPAPGENLPAPNLAAVAAMSDECGLLQHSAYGVADRAHGYCIDDNARALILMNRYEAQQRALGPHEALPARYAAFVNHAWNEEAGRFRNFMGYDRRWIEHAGSEDSFGRAIWALGHTIEWSKRSELRLWAESLIRRALAHATGIVSPRARAFMILGLAGLLAARPEDGQARALMETFAADLSRQAARVRADDWIWFEPLLAYDNARLAEGLLRAGVTLDRPRYVAEGAAALAWLCRFQSAPNGRFRAVGTAGMGQNLARAAPFDQQPVEAAATIDACAAAYEASEDGLWLREARRAFAWYGGANDLCIAVADPARGGCYDGLTPAGVNLNQGAESILSFQMATCAMHALERAARRPPARIAAAR